MYDFMFDKMQKTIHGMQGHNPFRVSLHALRRFGTTFHYWVTYKKDVVKLSKLFGYSKIETAFQSYIMPFEAIGLTQEMIDNKISIDQFIQLRGKRQKVIPDWYTVPKPIFLEKGQTSLADFR